MISFSSSLSSMKLNSYGELETENLSLLDSASLSDSSSYYLYINKINQIIPTMISFSSSPSSSMKLNSHEEFD